MILSHTRDVLKGSIAIKNRVDKGSKYPGIYADNGPQSVRGEYILLTDVSGDHEYALSGEIGTVQTVVQIDCYADRAEYAKSLFMLVRNRLSGFSDSVIAEATIIGGLGSAVDNPADSSDRFVHRYSKDFLIFHYESAPTLT